MGNDTAEHEKALAELNEDDLYNALDTEPKKLAFWLNLYNAFV
jgi:hypothetical protein